MFRCQLCGGCVPPRTPAARVVATARPKAYPHRLRANVFYLLDSEGKRKQRATDDPGGTGWEIARELLVCPGCAGRSGPRRE